MSDEFTRRNLLRATATTAAAGLGVTGTAAAAGTDTDVRVTGPIPCQKFDETALETVSASEPLPETATGIQPGSQIFIEFPDATAGCTANFIWRQPRKTEERPVEDDGPADEEASEEQESSNADGEAIEEEQETETVVVQEEKLYIGAAGHCFLGGGANASENAKREGETEDDLYDTSQLTVKICKNCNVGGAAGLIVARGEVYELGDVVYARQNTPDGDEVGYDFGLVEIPEELHHAVDPSIPQFGGPIGYEDGAVPEGETVAQYGAGVGNGEVFPTMASRGVSEGELGTPESWYAGIRASPGDSGSLLMEYELGAGTDAAGVLTHLTTVGVAGTTIPQCAAMAKRDVDIDLELGLENGEFVDVEPEV